jgi:hypothetical protein
MGYLILVLMLIDAVIRKLLLPGASNPSQEAEIRRLTVASQPQGNSSQDSISKILNKKKKGWWSGSSGLASMRP